MTPDTRREIAAVLRVLAALLREREGFGQRIRDAFSEGAALQAAVGHWTGEEMWRESESIDIARQYGAAPLRAWEVEALIDELEREPAREVEP